MEELAIIEEKNRIDEYDFSNINDEYIEKFSKIQFKNFTGIFYNLLMKNAIKSLHPKPLVG